MRNTFAGVCYRCGEPVAPGAGYFERIMWHVPRSREIAEKMGIQRGDSKRLTQHEACCHRWSDTAHTYKDDLRKEMEKA